MDQKEDAILAREIAPKRTARRNEATAVTSAAATAAKEEKDGKETKDKDREASGKGSTQREKEKGKRTMLWMWWTPPPKKFPGYRKLPTVCFTGKVPRRAKRMRMVRVPEDDRTTDRLQTITTTVTSSS